MILKAWPVVVPVCIDGMDKVLPVGSPFARFFKRIYVNYGRPLQFSEFKGRGKNKETAQAVIDKAMEAIKILHGEIQEMKALKNKLRGASLRRRTRHNRLP